MNKLLSVFRRSHRPDIDSLSGYLDARLSPHKSAAFEAHLASCNACRIRLTELGEVRSALAALPQAEAPRSFRLQPWQVGERPSHRPRLVYAVPALGFAAAVALVVLIGADVSGGSGGSKAARPGAESFARSAPADATDVAAATARSTADRAAAPAAGQAALATPPTAMLENNLNPPALAPAPGAPAAAPTAAPSAAAKSVDAQPSPTSEQGNQVRIAPPTQGAAATQKQQGPSTGDGIDWIRIGEVIAACVAIGAGGLTAGLWILRR